MKFHLPSFYLFPIPIKPLLPPAMSFLACALCIISPIPCSRREASQQLCGAWLPGRVKPPHTSTSLTGKANCNNAQQAPQKTPPPQYCKNKILYSSCFGMYHSKLKIQETASFVTVFSEEVTFFHCLHIRFTKNIDGVACKTSGSLLLPLILAQQIHQHQLTS